MHLLHAQIRELIDSYGADAVKKAIVAEARDAATSTIEMKLPRRMTGMSCRCGSPVAKNRVYLHSAYVKMMCDQCAKVAESHGAMVTYDHRE